MILAVKNNLVTPQTPYTYTTTNLAGGGTVVPVRNINGITHQYAQQFGRTGEEQAEIVTVSGTPSGTSFNTGAALRFAHSIDTPIYQVHYDAIIFKRSTTGTAGTATALATVNITPDHEYTQYDDVAGLSTYAYKTQYYNTVSGDTSSETDWFVVGGPSFYSLQKIAGRVRSALNDATFLADDTVIHDWINEWVEMETNAAISVNQAYATGTAQYSFGTAGVGTITEPLFKSANKVEVSYNTVDFVQSREVPQNRLYGNELISSLSPVHSWTGNTTFQVAPYQEGGVVRFSLNLFFSPLQDDTDELPQFLKPYTTGCIEYALYRAYDNDLKPDTAERHYQKFLLHEAKLLKQITPRDQSGVKFIEQVEELSGRNDELDWYF